MRSDYVVFFICIVLLIVKYIIKFIEINSTRCCGDCLSYEKCWSEKYDRNCYETPSCGKFQEKLKKEEDL